MTTIGAIWHTGQLLPGGRELDPRDVAGYDVHVLRDTTSLPLRSILMLADETRSFSRADEATLPADVRQVVFFGQFAGTVAGGMFSGGGVRVNTHTGEVTATPNPPVPRLRSFLIDAQILKVGNQGLLHAPPLRVYIHESVTDIWLTPSILTLPGDTDGQRFSVLARFDDDTVGDITRLASAPLAAGQPAEPGFTWASSDVACVRFDPQGRLSRVFGLFTCSSTITSTLRQPGWPTRSASAQVTGVEPWGDQRPTRRDLHLVSGPGVNDASEVSNILILPDGFQDTPEDRNDFDKLVALVVNRLNTSPSTTPFDMLSGSINYWSLFVPSREHGSTTLADLIEKHSLFDGPAKTPVTTLAVDGQRLAGDSQIGFIQATLDGGLPKGVHFTIAGDPTLYTTTNGVTAQGNAVRGVQFTPALAQTAPNNAVVTIIGRRMSLEQFLENKANLPWLADVEDLIRVVGLPVPAERLTHMANPSELNAKKAQWTTLYGASRIKGDRITNLVYDFWARWLPDHRLADEKDTAFGLAIGERPRAQLGKDHVTITWHPLRTSRTDLDKFLNTLTFQGTGLGPTWTTQAGGAAGKDRELVFILARGACRSGSNAPAPQQITAVGLVEDMNVRVRYGAGRSMQLVSHPMSRDLMGNPSVTNLVHGTLAHEAAHTLTLLDEYGGQVSMPSGGTEERRTFEYGNVTPRREVLAGSGITGEHLRWRWARIINAGVLAASPTPEPGVANIFTIKLRPGHPTSLGFNLFQVGDVVYLRQRPLFKPPAGNPPVLNRALESPPLTIIAPTRPMAENELQVRLQAGVLNPTDFSATGVDAPILFKPLQAAASAAAAGDKYAEIIAQFIRAHINRSGRPLNALPPPPAPPPPPPWVCVPPLGDGFMEPQAATNLPPPALFPGGRLPAIPSRIIGAYEGGATFSCGIYHPAGSCIMRAPLASRPEERMTFFPIPIFLKDDVHMFCTVCRYLIVDRIDPRLHGHVDALYHTYPQP